MSNVLELMPAFDDHDLDWAQRQVTAHHYLHKPVPDRAFPFAYVIVAHGQPAGCLIFGRTHATKCFKGKLTYGDLEHVESGRAKYSRWEVLNLARVWLHPRIQSSGSDHIYDAATRVISMGLKQVVLDYLIRHPPCFLDEPWRLRMAMSYCDTTLHSGIIYKAAGFELAHVNAKGKQTWMRPLRGLQGRERKQVEYASAVSPRSNQFRAERAQMELDLCAS